MSNVVIFTPKEKLANNKNLQNFIEFSEKLPHLNKEYNYTSAYWPKVVNFTKFKISSRDRKEENQLHSSIIPFAKAYLTYSQTQNRTKNPNEIKALRAVEAAMLKGHGTVDITKINSTVLDVAAQIMKDKLGKKAAYHGGSQLEKLQKFLVKKLIIPQFTWENTIKRAEDTIEKVGEEGRKNREEKLPDEDALLAIAEIFNKGEHNLSGRDIFTTSTISILLCAPARGSEPFYLKFDCLHYDKDIKGNNSVGLKWYSGKGFGYEIEWIPDVMVPVIEEAVKRLIHLTEPARQWAKKVEKVAKETPSLFPRHPLCPKVSDVMLLTRTEVVQALGYNLDLTNKKFMSNAGNFLKKRGLKITDNQYCLSDLVPTLNNCLPNGFPNISYKTGKEVTVKWSEALFTFFSDQINTKKNTNSVELWIPNINTLNEDLAPTKKKQKNSDEFTNIQSIFERHGYPSHFIITSHQIRHMLSTIAKVNGMSDQLLTKWAGRANDNHNRVYNHTTPEQYSKKHAMIKKLNNNKNELGLHEFEVMTPETFQEINTRSIQTAHVTEYGACIHDFIMSPCSKHRDCINCNEQVCIKGDNEKLDRLKKRLDREKLLLGNDKGAVDEGLLGADRHYQKRLITIKRCEELIVILSDENLPDGTEVKLSIENISNLDKALDKNHKKRLPKIEKIRNNKIEKAPNKHRVLKNYRQTKRL